ncbi:MAG TPA: ABC transporter ATP-binding protein [Acidimicrobiia bacterium]|nr:ABC transporter ATP-binding protein [Acidimicrobiia bacterium]
MTILAAHDVTKRFGGVVALAGVSFHVEPGKIVGVVGPNGAGKTTLFDIIAGLQPPTAGQVELDGRRITGLPAHRIARLGLARTFQIPRLFVQLDILQNVLVGAYTSGLGRHEAHEVSMESLARVGLADRAHVAAERLNLADRRRLEIARVLALRPRVVLLDEAMSGLNDAELVKMIDLVRTLNRDGTTFVLVEHVMKVVMTLCARVVVIDHGAVLVEDVPQVVVKDRRVIEAYLGQEIDVPA